MAEKMMRWWWWPIAVYGVLCIVAMVALHTDCLYLYWYRRPSFKQNITESNMHSQDQRIGPLRSMNLSSDVSFLNFNSVPEPSIADLEKQRSLEQQEKVNPWKNKITEEKFLLSLPSGKGSSIKIRNWDQRPPLYMEVSELLKLVLPGSAPTCNASKQNVWVAIVSSAPKHSYNREQIRKTWARFRPVVFLLGTPSEELQVLINQEINEYGDIVQGAFQDSYANLTFKHIMGLLWFNKQCPGAKYLLKVDDDVFVNRPYFENYLHLHAFHRMILCSTVIKGRVGRSFRSKWRVSYLEFSQKHYPTYCSGWAVVYTADSAKELLNEALKEPLFWVDDVLITGILAEKLNISRANWGHLGIEEEESEEVLSGSPRVDFMFSLTEPKNFQVLWDMINHYTISNQILPYSSLIS